MIKLGATAATSLLIAVTFCFVCSLAGSSYVSARAQQQPLTPLAEDTALGIGLYQQGDTKGAIKTLSEAVSKRPRDADALYYLGLARIRDGWVSSAREAFEAVVQLRPDSADAHAKLAVTLLAANASQRAALMAERALELGDQSAEAHYVIGEANLRTNAPAKALEKAEAALKINPELLPALVTKSFAHLGLKQHKEAAESLEKFLALSPNNLDADAWRGQLEELRRRAIVESERGSDAESLVLLGSQVTTKARILSKPEPQYTEGARRAGVQGTIVLSAVFSSDGTVKHVLIIKSPGYGLTTVAVEAARQIRFMPALKDGRPASMIFQLEYNFNVY